MVLSWLTIFDDKHFPSKGQLFLILELPPSLISLFSWKMFMLWLFVIVLILLLLSVLTRMRLFGKWVSNNWKKYWSVLVVTPFLCRGSDYKTRRWQLCFSFFDLRINQPVSLYSYNHS